MAVLLPMALRRGDLVPGLGVFLPFPFLFLASSSSAFRAATSALVCKPYRLPILTGTAGCSGTGGGGVGLCFTSLLVRSFSSSHTFRQPTLNTTLCLSARTSWRPETFLKQQSNKEQHFASVQGHHEDLKLFLNSNPTKNYCNNTLKKRTLKNIGASKRFKFKTPALPVKHSILLMK